MSDDEKSAEAEKARLDAAKQVYLPAQSAIRLSPPPALSPLPLLQFFLLFG